MEQIVDSKLRKNGTGRQSREVGEKAGVEHAVNSKREQADSFEEQTNGTRN